ncbi:hypothetical protein [Pontibacter sp. G13]|uniref:hypothetical protein n=1 Tax=Pontibacter sp. G13 TaxID=3074898 RepID=UPI00288968BC|nr:hypothetical protein [Pontibacter sp. G13]WNJ17457.1 hypothetical protein RJD25_21630 [Pontibacter sp. G13]
MEIRRIFPLGRSTSEGKNQLNAVLYPGDETDSFEKTFRTWHDEQHLMAFFEANQWDMPSHWDFNFFTNKVEMERESFLDLLLNRAVSERLPLDLLFKPLRNEEYVERELSLNKARPEIRRSILRLYALRIDMNCFLITGGAIKVTARMQEAQHTNLELIRLNQARDYLAEQGITDVYLFQASFNFR